MTIWTRITDFVGSTAGNALGALIEQVRTALEGDPETRAKVNFSIAMIALSAKMAKADGIVTEDEVEAFREIFEIPDSDAARVSHIYNLAKQDTAGYQAYAHQMARICGSGADNCPVMEDILDGLFHIAKADGVVHEKEIEFLETVAAIFRVDEKHFARIKARHIIGPDDPWVILGIDRSAGREEARNTYLKLVKENHPDAVLARGLPAEFIRIANERVATINTAWEKLEDFYADN